MNSLSPLNIVLVGIHGAGKTTIGTLLARELAIPYHCEIGKTLRRKVLRGNPDCHALTSGESFDERVMLYEMVRDLNSAGPRVVETWHPGNLAFAFERSPAVYDRYRSLLDKHIEYMRGTTIIQPLIVTTQTAQQRQSEFGDDATEIGAYFCRVAERTERLINDFGLTSLTPLATDDLAPHLCAKQIAAQIIDLRRGHSVVLN